MTSLKSQWNENVEIRKEDDAAMFKALTSVAQLAQTQGNTCNERLNVFLNEFNECANQLDQPSFSLTSKDGSIDLENLTETSSQSNMKSPAGHDSKRAMQESQVENSPPPPRVLRRAKRTKPVCLNHPTAKDGQNGHRI